MREYIGGGIMRYANHSMDKSERANFLKVQTLFILLYYNFLLITDIDEFTSNNIFSPKELSQIIQFMIKQTTDLLWHVPKENDLLVMERFQVYYISKLLT